VRGRATRKTFANRLQVDIDGMLILFKICSDFYVCAVCPPAENELVVAQLLEGVYLYVWHSLGYGVDSGFGTTDSLIGK